MIPLAQKIMTGNQAAACIAYKTNEICAVYPITPATGMAEYVEEASANNRPNIFDTVPEVIEMQSEAGVAGVMHGALQTGALATTFTASQGLLLMLPNMYKIAGELTPNVIHVATRSIATHALSVFCDHSDVMAARSTGYALLSAATVQETMDFALIAQAASLASRIPFVHFFDGFRTSHEAKNIEIIDDEIIKELIKDEWVLAHQERSLTPENPVVRGTAQGPNTFFQSREAINPYYEACPEITQSVMDQFYTLTGRKYSLFDYVGDPQASKVLVCMASASETVEETIKELNKNGGSYGLLKVRLYRPFSGKDFVEAIPNTCQSIAVLDRTKEPGASGEPLYLDTVQSFYDAFSRGVIKRIPQIVGGRFGLSSKEFTPAMVKAVFDNLSKPQPKNNFTIGIQDDVTQLSLPFDSSFQLKDDNYKIIVSSEKKPKSELSYQQTLEIFNEKFGKHVQGYNEVDYQKVGGKLISHIRLSDEPFQSPYLISNADFLIAELSILKTTPHLICKLKDKGKLILVASNGDKSLSSLLTKEITNSIRQKEITVLNYKENLKKEAREIDSIAFASMLDYFQTKDLNNYFPFEEIKIDGVIKKNDFTHASCDYLIQFDFPVSSFPVDGTYDKATAHQNPIHIGNEFPEVDLEQCTQCGVCSMICPQAALKMKVIELEALEHAPNSFKATPALDEELGPEDLYFGLQVDPKHCTSCGLCIDFCEENALKRNDAKENIEEKQQVWDFFDALPNIDKTKLNLDKLNQQQLQEPLFKFPHSEQGCSQTPYLKLLSQLFGDRMIVANATGSSSIFGGMPEALPWYKDQNGRGPAWSNSLFEDAAEFGLGFRMTMDHKKERALFLIKELEYLLGNELVTEIINAKQHSVHDIHLQRKRILAAQDILQLSDLKEAKELIKILDALVEKNVWIVGGDGWAYDIGFGGIDHVLASGKNVNILVMDNQAYGNTGGQMSKATPYGASASLALKGKKTQRKDLGLLAMQYDDVYVASIAMGADPYQTLKALNEAANYPGPSLVIAYCHSATHGIKGGSIAKQYKDIVDAGHWKLYRRDPKKKEVRQLQLDSAKPTLPLLKWMATEKRFDRFLKANENYPDLRISDMQYQAINKYHLLETYQT